VTGADVERGIELFNRRSVDRGLRERAARTSGEEFDPVADYARYVDGKHRR
jgi:hypothetical protein